MGAKVEFPIGKKFVPFRCKPGTSRCQTILFSEYEPLNKYSFYLLLDTYQLIQGQGTRGAKVPPLWGQQKNIPCIDAWARGKPFWFADWAMTDFFIAVDLELVQTTRNVKLNGTRNSVRKFQPGKRAHLSRFSTFSGNFPVGRTDETCSIYRRTNRKFLKFWLNDKRPKCSISERSTVLDWQSFWVSSITERSMGTTPFLPGNKTEKNF